MNDMINNKQIYNKIAGNPNKGIILLGLPTMYVFKSDT